MALSSVNPAQMSRPRLAAYASPKNGTIRSNSHSSSKNLSVRLPKSSRISPDSEGGVHPDFHLGRLLPELDPGANSLHIQFPKVIAEASHSTTFGGTVVTSNLNDTI